MWPVPRSRSWTPTLNCGLPSTATTVPLMLPVCVEEVRSNGDIERSCPSEVAPHSGAFCAKETTAKEKSKIAGTATTLILKLTRKTLPELDPAAARRNQPGSRELTAVMFPIWRGYEGAEKKHIAGNLDDENSGSAESWESKRNRGYCSAINLCFFMFSYVVQLADISRPWIRLAQVQRIVVDLADLLSGFFRRAFYEILQQHRNVLPPLF